MFSVLDNEDDLPFWKFSFFLLVLVKTIQVLANAVALWLCQFIFSVNPIKSKVKSTFTLALEFTTKKHGVTSHSSVDSSFFYTVRTKSTLFFFFFFSSFFLNLHELSINVRVQGILGHAPWGSILNIFLQSGKNSTSQSRMIGLMTYHVEVIKLNPLSFVLCFGQWGLPSFLEISLFPFGSRKNNTGISKYSNSDDSYFLWFL